MCSSYILKCNWTVHVALFPTFQSNRSYKYTSKHVNYVLIRFMCCVLKYQLPPTATTSSQSLQERELLVDATSCGDRPLANEHAEKLSAKCQSDSQTSFVSPYFLFLRQRSVIRFCHTAGR